MSTYGKRAARYEAAEEIAERGAVSFGWHLRRYNPARQGMLALHKSEIRLALQDMRYPGESVNA
jgi:hypothetical protein